MPSNLRFAAAVACTLVVATFSAPVVAAKGFEEPAAERAQAASRAAPPAEVALPAEALSDPAITARVKSKLERDSRLAGSLITVSTNAGVVSLTGHVRSEEQLAAAEAHASDDGVMRVDNHLAIQPR